MRLLGLLAAALLAGDGTLVSTTSIGGARLGQTGAQYKAAFGPPSHLDHLEGGLDRLDFPKRKVDVYFKTGATRGIAIVAWSSAFKTAKGIGPCSTEAALKAAYPKLVRVLSGGPERVYRLGATLYFDVESGKLQSVAIGKEKTTAYYATNSLSCNQ